VPGKLAMVNLALLGKNISHSKSKEVYQDLLRKKIDYRLIDCSHEDEIPTLDEIFAKSQGLSITSPYKKYFLKQVSFTPEIDALGAINCIKKCKDGYIATNTDFTAVSEILVSMIKEKEITQIAILGDGSMSTITCRALEQSGFENYQVFSRRKTDDFEQLNFKHEHKGRMLVINSCSRQYVFKGKLEGKIFFWDYNYSYPPHYERFSASMDTYLDGYSLLRLQALHALRFWEIK